MFGPHRATTLLTTLLLAGLPLACGDDGTSESGSGTGESGDETAATMSSASETSAGSASGDGDGDTTGDGDGDPATGDGDGDTTGDGDGDTTGDGDGDTTGDGDGDGDTGDGDGDTTGDGDGDTTGDGDGDMTGDGDGDGDMTGDGDGEGCLDEEIACDGLDEDCNGIVDDLDAGDDGFCDCYRIGIIGNKGSNPGANFESWLEEKGTTATRFGTMGNHVLTEDDLADIDILIVDRLTHVYSDQERDLLQAWLEAGHGMITMAGYANNDADRNQQNSLTTASGLSYATPIYINPTENWLMHPITEGINDAVQVYGGWRVVGNGDVFVRPQGEDNNSFGTTVDLGEGKAIVFSDEWISFDSEWQNIPEVEVFWVNMVHWVGPSNICFEPQ